MPLTLRGSYIYVVEGLGLFFPASDHRSTMTTTTKNYTVRAGVIATVKGLER